MQQGNNNWCDTIVKRVKVILYKRKKSNINNKNREDIK